MGDAHSVKSQRTVLLVDDEDFLRRLLARMLDEAGFAAVEAENGKAALDVALKLDGTLQLVVTDIHMPVMNGLEFAREFRPRHPTIPILFITGRDLSPGIDPPGPEDTCLRKPFGSQVFVQTVERLVAGGP